MTVFGCNLYIFKMPSFLGMKKNLPCLMTVYFGVFPEGFVVDIFNSKRLQFLKSQIILWWKQKHKHSLNQCWFVSNYVPLVLVVLGSGLNNDLLLYSCLLMTPLHGHRLPVRYFFYFFIFSFYVDSFRETFL